MTWSRLSLVRMVRVAGVAPLTWPCGQKLNVACGAVLPAHSFTSRSSFEARVKIWLTTSPNSSRRLLDFSAGTVSGGGATGFGGSGVGVGFGFARFGALLRLAKTANVRGLEG